MKTSLLLGACALSVAPFVHASLAGPSDDEALVKRYVEELWNTGDFSVATKLLAPTFTRASPVGDAASRDEFQAAFEETTRIYAGIKVTTQGLSTAHGRVWLDWTFAARFVGPGAAAGGVPVEIEGTSVFECADGKIQSEEIGWNHVAAARMIDQLPVASAAAANRDTVATAIDAMYNRGEFSSAREMLTDDYVLHVTASSLGNQGPNEAVQRAAAFRTGFPDLEFKLHETIAQGDLVATRYTFTGTHKGSFLNVAATGKRIEITGVAMIRCTNGKMSEAWSAWDTGDLYRQLGATPPK